MRQSRRARRDPCRLISVIRNKLGCLTDSCHSPITEEGNVTSEHRFRHLALQHN